MAPSKDWKEVIAPDEAERHQRHADMFRELQKNSARNRPISRALHAKPQLGVQATFTVLPGLPPHAQFGIAQEPKTFDALVRFSNGSPRRVPDQTPDVRGIAVKVLGVPGKKLIPGMEDETTQDFLCALGLGQPFRNSDEFVWFVAAAAAGRASLPLKAMLKFGPLRAIDMIRRGLKNTLPKIFSVANCLYGSKVPIQWGPYAAKYYFEGRAPVEPGAQQGTSKDYLGEELAARLSRGPVEFDFKVQFFEDERRTPIEDASVEWTLEAAPPVTVARLTIPSQQDVSQRERIEGLSFDPWHALVEHKPLGDMMRARNVTYRVSTEQRKAAGEPR
jgi:hypothetical protein